MIDPVKVEQCRKRFSEEPGLLAVWLLGSAVSGRLRDDSDVDFALCYRPDIEFDFEAYGSLLLDLESILDRKVDLGRIHSGNLVYAEQAIQTGELIYATDPQLALTIASRMHTLYLDLKLDRKVVEEAYCA